MLQSHPTIPALTPEAAALPRWLTAKQVAAYLECSERSVYRLNDEGLLPGHHHGTRSWRWDRDVVIAYGRGQMRGGSPANVTLEEQVEQNTADIARVQRAIVAAMAAWEREMGGRA